MPQVGYGQRPQDAREVAQGEEKEEGGDAQAVDQFQPGAPGKIK
jgi:hypothetical protein